MPFDDAVNDDMESGCEAAASHDGGADDVRIEMELFSRASLEELRNWNPCVLELVEQIDVGDDGFGGRRFAVKSEDVLADGIQPFRKTETRDGRIENRSRVGGAFRQPLGRG